MTVSTYVAMIPVVTSASAMMATFWTLMAPTVLRMVSSWFSSWFSVSAIVLTVLTSVSD